MPGDGRRNLAPDAGRRPMMELVGEDGPELWPPEMLARLQPVVRNGPTPTPVTDPTLNSKSGPGSVEGPPRQWFKINALGGNAADLWVYDEIGGWGVTAEMLVTELAGLNVADITVHVNSP